MEWTVPYLEVITCPEPLSKMHMFVRAVHLMIKDTKRKDHTIDITWPQPGQTFFSLHAYEMRVMKTERTTRSRAVVSVIPAVQDGPNPTLPALSPSNLTPALRLFQRPSAGYVT